MAGSSISKVTLSESAIKHIAIKTAPITELAIAPRRAGPAVVRKVVPYSAVIYDLNGATWVYTNPEAMVYIREPITVDFVRGDSAALHDGPPVDTQVVVIGAAELYGVETGVGK